jgi:hypothetical protein
MPGSHGASARCSSTPVSSMWRLRVEAPVQVYTSSPEFGAVLPMTSSTYRVRCGRAWRCTTRELILTSSSRGCRRSPLATSAGRTVPSRQPAGMSPSDGRRSWTRPSRLAALLALRSVEPRRPASAEPVESLPGPAHQGRRSTLSKRSASDLRPGCCLGEPAARRVGQLLPARYVVLQEDLAD